MPYIDKAGRSKFERLKKEMAFSEIRTPGELNYLLTTLVHVFLNQKSIPHKTYQNYNDALGALEGAKLELYRQHIASYENEKIEQNGNVP